MAPAKNAKTKPKKTSKTTRSQAPQARQPFANGNWIGGTTLVVLGLLFLAQYYTPFKLDNWWALFLFIPTVAAWASAYRFYRVDNHVGRATWSAFIGGLFPALVAIIFINNLDWGKVWPLFLILAGLAALSPRRKGA